MYSVMVIPAAIHVCQLRLSSRCWPQSVPVNQNGPFSWSQWFTQGRAYIETWPNKGESHNFAHGKNREDMMSFFEWYGMQIWGAEWLWPLSYDKEGILRMQVTCEQGKMWEPHRNSEVANKPLKLSFPLHISVTKAKIQEEFRGKRLVFIRYSFT